MTTDSPPAATHDLVLQALLDAPPDTPIVGEWVEVPWRELPEDIQAEARERHRLWVQAWTGVYVAQVQAEDALRRIDLERKTLRWVLLLVAAVVVALSLYREMS